jgi:hypothetical protein
MKLRNWIPPLAAISIISADELLDALGHSHPAAGPAWTQSRDSSGMTHEAEEAIDKGVSDDGGPAFTPGTGTAPAIAGPILARPWFVQPWLRHLRPSV